MAHSDAQLAAAARSHVDTEATHGQTLYTQIEPLKRFYLAEDYHQKYRLGRVPGVVDELRQFYPRYEDYADSTVAMRINAHLGGYLSRAQLDDEIGRYGLSQTAQRELVQAAYG